MASVTGTGYPIARTTGQCAATGRALAVGERYVATLVEVEGAADLRRVDFSLDAWKDGARPAALIPGGLLFASWQASVHEPSARKGVVLDPEELLDIFESLAEATEPRKLSFRYLLALMLIRKRVLKYEGQRQGVMLVKRTGPLAGEPIPVTDPGLDEIAIRGALEELGEMMGLSGKEAS
jgi:hypothetical protein